MRNCSVCREDQGFLRQTERPDYSGPSPQLRVVDLFSGCGGLTLGLAEAARRAGLGLAMPFAVDLEQSAADVFAANLPVEDMRCGRVEELFDGDLGGRITLSERSLRRSIGEVHALVGGPPCQGHSDLNNHSRRNDGRNPLYARMARAAEVLSPRAVLVENVAGVRWDKGDVVGHTKQALEKAGYTWGEKLLDMTAFGVPQRRRRYVLLAARGDQRWEPQEVLDNLEPRCPDHSARTARWAIGDLLGRTAESGFDAPSKATVVNQRRMKWLFDHDEYDLPNSERPKCHREDDPDHTYRSVYGRLRWDRPAQTITTGFGSMGQGRYVHPARQRTITPHEAARLQTFPDFFDFGDHRRGQWASMIGNAVPPLLNIVIGQALIAEMGLAARVDDAEVLPAS